MKANRLLLGAALAVAALSIVTQDAQAQGKASFDAKGWVLLGQKQVHGKKDKDMIHVGRKKLPPVTKVMLVVEDSDLEITDLEIQFGNGEKVSPSVKHFFKEGARTRAIDLPGEKRHIAHFTLKYGNLPGDGKAKVLVYGKEEAAGGGEPIAVGEPVPGEKPPLGKARWDRNGWVKLGEKVVNGKADHDVVPVGRAEGKFIKVMMVVEDSELELNDMKVTFENGETFDPKVKHFFRENDRTRGIDLPREGHSIKRVDLKYGNVPGGGRARVEIWGQEKGGDGGSVGSTPTPGGRPRGPYPLVADFWPRRGAAGAKLRIQGRRFAPGLKVVFGDVAVDPTIDDPFMMTVAVPAGLKGTVPVMLRHGDRDVPVGIFTVGGKAEDRAKIRAKFRAEAEKWWKLREKQLAKDVAAREAALAKAEAELAALRAKRREERLLKLREKWKAELLAREEARIELAVHAERAARLARMERLAESVGNGGLAIRIHFLIGIEGARHEARMGDLKLAVIK